MFNDIRIFTGTTTGAGPRRDFHITYFAIKLCVTSQSALLAASNFRGALISRLGQMHDRMLGCVSYRFCNSAIPVDIRKYVTNPFTSHPFSTVKVHRNTRLGNALILLYRCVEDFHI